MTYTCKYDHGIICIMDGSDPLFLTPEQVREERDEAEQRFPLDLAWVAVLDEAIGLLTAGE